MSDYTKLVAEARAAMPDVLQESIARFRAGGLGIPDSWRNAEMAFQLADAVEQLQVRVRELELERRRERMSHIVDEPDC